MIKLQSTLFPIMRVHILAKHNLLERDLKEQKGTIPQLQLKNVNIRLWRLSFKNFKLVLPITHYKLSWRWLWKKTSCLTVYFYILLNIEDFCDSIAINIGKTYLKLRRCIIKTRISYKKIVFFGWRKSANCSYWKGEEEHKAFEHWKETCKLYNEG